MTNMNSRQRPDLLSSNTNDQGLLRIIDDLERRVLALEKQWRKAIQTQTQTQSQSSSPR